MVQYYTSSISLTNFVIWSLLLNSFSLQLFSFRLINEIFLTSLEACFLYTVLVYLQIFYEVRTKLQVPKIIIPNTEQKQIW